MQISQPLIEDKAWRERWFPNGEWVLAMVVLFEIAIFSAIGENFFTTENFFEVIRLSVELGLLSLAMTPIVITGGIDLSVGSMMALAAVIFGAAWHDAGLPIPVAAALALLTGAFGGAANDDLRPGPASLGAAAKPSQRAMLPGAPSPQRNRQASRCKQRSRCGRCRA